MRFRPNKLAAYAIFAGALLASMGHTAPRHIHLEQLGNPSKDETANDRFATFTRQLALCFSPHSPSPPHTLGWLGTSATAFVSFEKPNWEAIEKLRRETTGPLLSQTSPLWTQLGIAVRKGLPYSFEVGLHAKWLSQSAMWTLAGDLRWAFEGIDYLPNFSIRVHLQQLFGASPLQLATGGMDLSLGYAFALPKGFILSAFGGWDLVFVYAASQRINFDDGEAKFTSLKPFSNSHNRLYAALRLSYWNAFAQLSFSYSVLKTPAAAAPADNPPPSNNDEGISSSLLSANFGAGYLF
ncbi:MAG: hypothetical protein FWD46_08120 [Cystobacterineae bacterium]|nr:hypothetical protein [Cystobacterineae bacterium]